MSALPLATTQRQDDEYRKDKEHLKDLSRPHAFRRARKILLDVCEKLKCLPVDNSCVVWSTRPKALRIYDGNGCEIVSSRPKKRCVAYCRFEEPISIPGYNGQIRYLGIAGDGATENATNNVDMYYLCVWERASEWRIIGLVDSHWTRFWGAGENCVEPDGIWIPSSCDSLVAMMKLLGLPNNAPGRDVTANRQRRKDMQEQRTAAVGETEQTGFVGEPVGGEEMPPSLAPPPLVGDPEFPEPNPLFFLQSNVNAGLEALGDDSQYGTPEPMFGQEDDGSAGYESSPFEDSISVVETSENHVFPSYDDSYESW